MDDQAMFLNCPAYLDSDGAARCGLPAEVAARYVISSTDGPVESASITCPRGHHFNGPIEYLAMPQRPAAAAVSASLRARPITRGQRPSLQPNHTPACELNQGDTSD